MDNCVVRFILSNDQTIRVAASAAASSKVVSAAMNFNLPKDGVFDFPLLEWRADVAEYCVQTMIRFVHEFLDFDFWMEAVKLSSYLEMNEHLVICRLPTRGGVDIDEIIRVAISHRIVGVLLKVWKAEPAELSKVLASYSHADILWLVSTRIYPYRLGVCGMEGRTIDEIEEILLAMMTRNTKEPVLEMFDYSTGWLKVIINSAIPLRPLTRHLLERIIDLDDHDEDLVMHIPKPFIVGQQTITGSKTFQ